LHPHAGWCLYTCVRNQIRVDAFVASSCAGCLAQVVVFVLTIEIPAQHVGLSFETQKLSSIAAGWSSSPAACVGGSLFTGVHTFLDIVNPIAATFKTIGAHTVKLRALFDGCSIVILFDFVIDFVITLLRSDGLLPLFDTLADLVGIVFFPGAEDFRSLIAISSFKASVIASVLVDAPRDGSVSIPGTGSESLPGIRSETALAAGIEFTLVLWRLQGLTLFDVFLFLVGAPEALASLESSVGALLVIDAAGFLAVSKEPSAIALFAFVFLAKGIIPKTVLAG